MDPKSIGRHIPDEFFTNLSLRDINNFELVTKFGHNNAVGTSYVPLTVGGIYQVPQVSGATTLRIRAGNAADTAAGVGAREITIQGIDQLGNRQTAVLATAGASASASTTITFMRVFRAFVSASGTYATATAGSHTANIIVENTAGTTIWAVISTAYGFPESQTGIGVYTIPLGKHAYVVSIAIAVDSGKTGSVFGFFRQGVLKTTAPYDAMRVFIEFGGVSGPAPYEPKGMLGPFPELTDIGFMGKVSATTGGISCTFEIILIDNEHNGFDGGVI